MIERSDENSTFHIERLLIYSNASVINNSNNSSLNDMSICQYSDISIYIDNKLENSELTDENTVKQLYIDNITISPQLKHKGKKLLNYKNPLIFGKYTNIEQYENDRIDFNIVNNNDQNYSNNYNDPTFYTDCSNPITLGYLNKNVVKSFSISDTSNTVSFNSRVFKEANVSLEDLNYQLDFTINIVNYLDQKFSCDLNIDIDFDDSFLENGYSFKGAEISGSEYRFLKN